MQCNETPTDASYYIAMLCALTMLTRAEFMLHACDIFVCFCNSSWLGLAVFVFWLAVGSYLVFYGSRPPACQLWECQKSRLCFF